jgi:hypothetical protein
MLYTVQVLDDSGYPVLSVEVSVPEDIGTNGEEAKAATSITDPELALFAAGPDICPFDCDRCSY